MKFTTHDHCGGTKAAPAQQLSEIEKAISACAIAATRGAATMIGDNIMDALMQDGWSGEVKLARDSKITITSAKNGVGLCLQTGNMSRMYADLVKLQKMFLDGNIKAGAMIVPGRSAARTLGDNIANGDRLQRELDIFRKVIHLPLIVFAFD